VVDGGAGCWRAEAQTVEWRPPRPSAGWDCGRQQRPRHRAPQHWAGGVRRVVATIGPTGRRLAGQGPRRGGSARRLAGHAAGREKQ